MRKRLGYIYVMIFIYCKVIYFCSLNIYLDSHKVKTIMLHCCYFAVTGWQSRYYVACSVLVVTAGSFLIHCTNCWKKKDSIPFYTILSLFILNTVDDITSRGQEKHVKLSSKLNSLFNHEMNSLFRRRQQFQASKLSLHALSIIFLKKNY